MIGTLNTILIGNAILYLRCEMFSGLAFHVPREDERCAEKV
jgi:hypothetical protein